MRVDVTKPFLIKTGSFLFRNSEGMLTLSKLHSDRSNNVYRSSTRPIQRRKMVIMQDAIMGNSKILAIVMH